MKTSEKMQEFVTKLADKHGLDLSAPHAYLALDMPGCAPLVITRGRGNLVTVIRYVELDGEEVAYPELVLLMADQGWVPIEASNYQGLRVCAELDDAYERIVRVLECQAELATAADALALEIEVAGWLKHGRSDRLEPDPPEAPDLETLMRWEAEGGCEAACSHGCWVEPDGHCPHGQPSWLLELGLI